MMAEVRWIPIREAAEKLGWTTQEDAPKQRQGAAQRLERRLVSLEQKTGAELVRRNGSRHATEVDWQLTEQYLCCRRGTAKAWAEWRVELERMAAQVADRRHQVRTEPRLDAIDARLDEEDQRYTAVIETLRQLTERMEELAEK